MDDSLWVTMTTCSAMDCCTDTTVSIPMQVTTLWVPNAFTPDGETNRVFAPVGQGIIDGELYIYNRNGLLVRHQNDYREGWDGKSSPQGGGGEVECPQGAYVWHFVYRTEEAPNNVKKATGMVMLLR